MSNKVFNLNACKCVACISQSQCKRSSGFFISCECFD
ncbi:MAG: hypothetical protein EBR82_44630 [Caulobacteraceae bacterium]|nr:hypothetical protein [Caulobacteraceae bacterium]